MTLLALWIAVPVAFWLAWLAVTAGRPLRHLGTLHFIIYFLSIYLASYDTYVTLGSRNHLFIYNVMAYPFLALAGVWLVGLTGRGGVIAGRLPAQGPSRRERRVVTIVGGGLFLALVTYLLILGPRIPLVALITDGREAGQVARSVATKLYNQEIGRIGPLVWGSRVLIDYFGIFLLVYEYCRARAAGTGFRRLVLLAGTLIVLTMSLNETYPVVKLLTYVSVFVVFGVVKPRISPRVVALMAVLFVIMLPVVGVVHAVVTSGPASLGQLGPTPVRTLYHEGWVQFVDRGIRGQVTGLYYTYEIVPRYHGYFWGRTFTNPRSILPYEQVNLPYLVYDWHLTSPTGVRGSDPSVFFGELYANFGLPASWVLMILMGAVMQAGTIAFSRAIGRRGSPYYVALFYMTMVYVADFAIGFSTLWFDERLWLVVTLFFLPRLVLFRRPAAASDRRPPGLHPGPGAGESAHA